jgi:hypothetical protein
MNTYDPADGIRYVHLAVEAGAPQASASSEAPIEAEPPCHRLDAGYANRQLQHRLSAGERPTFVVLPGGAAA